jgi:hypothetical protein
MTRYDFLRRIPGYIVFTPRIAFLHPQECHHIVFTPRIAFLHPQECHHRVCACVCKCKRVQVQACARVQVQACASAFVCKCRACASVHACAHIICARVQAERVQVQVQLHFLTFYDTDLCPTLNDTRTDFMTHVRMTRDVTCA